VSQKRPILVSQKRPILVPKEAYTSVKSDLHVVCVSQGAASHLI